MRKIIKDYLTKEYDNYVKDLEALTNISTAATAIWKARKKPINLWQKKCRRLARKPSSAITTAAAI